MTRTKQRAKKQQLLAQNAQFPSHNGRRHRPGNNQPRPHVSTRSDRNQNENQDNISFRNLEPNQSYVSSARQASHVHHHPLPLQINHHQGVRKSSSNARVQKNNDSRAITGLQDSRSQANYLPQQQANLQASSFAVPGMHTIGTVTASPNQTNLHLGQPLNAETDFEQFLGNPSSLYEQMLPNSIQPVGTHGQETSNLPQAFEPDELSMPEHSTELDQRLQEFEEDMMSKLDTTFGEWKHQILDELIPYLIRSLEKKGYIPTTGSGTRSDMADSLGHINPANLEHENQ